jgi:hypothetical protein
VIEVAQPPFALFPESRHWWSTTDYGAVLGVMRQLQPQTVLEFGPGSSTLALIEGGARRVDSCEDRPDWMATYRARIADKYPTAEFQTKVRIIPYTWSDPVVVEGLSEEPYDLALIDGPYTSEKRPPVIEFCLQRARVVLVPTEDDGRTYKSFLRPHIERLAAQYGWTVAYTETGPDSGGFALLTKTKPAAFQFDYADLMENHLAKREATIQAHTPTAVDVTDTMEITTSMAPADGEQRVGIDVDVPAAPTTKAQRRKLRKARSQEPGA